MTRRVTLERAPMPPRWPLFAIFFRCILFGVDAFTFHSPEGFDFLLVRRILLGALSTFEPHSYQLDGVCKALEKVFSPPHALKEKNMCLLV
jgi:hypothetical protein